MIKIYTPLLWIYIFQNKQIETRRQVAKQNVGKPEAKLEVDRIWMGPPESEKKGRGHVGLNDEHTDEVLEVGFDNKILCIKFLETANGHLILETINTYFLIF